MKKSLVFLVILNCSMMSNVFAQSILLTPDKIGQTGGTSDNISLRTFNGGIPNIIGINHGGTLLSPTSTSNNTTLLGIDGAGFSTSITLPSARIIMVTSENWSNTANGTGIIFNTTANGTTSIQERMKISHNGLVGIGLTNPNQILDINGRMRIRHTPGFTSGVWMSNSTNGLGDGDGAFFGLLNDTQAGIFIGNSWRFAFNNNGNAVITGFTQLGNDVPAGAAAGATAPAIKTLKLTGTTGATQGAFASVTHGLSFSKILSYSVLVNTGGGTPSLIPPDNTSDAALNYTVFCTGTSIFLINTSGSSSGLLSKPFRVLITYEE
jgi:hypothetical protein